MGVNRHRLLEGRARRTNQRRPETRIADDKGLLPEVQSPSAADLGGVRLEETVFDRRRPARANVRLHLPVVAVASEDAVANRDRPSRHGERGAGAMRIAEERAVLDKSLRRRSVEIDHQRRRIVVDPRIADVAGEEAVADDASVGRAVDADAVGHAQADMIAAELAADD